MNLKKEIKARFGTLTRFAELLNAPMGTVFSWTKKKGKRTPPEWQIMAYIDCASLRNLSTVGWECRKCGLVMHEIDNGVKPRECVVCGSGYFSPVRIVKG